MGGVSADGKVLWLSGRYNGVVYAILDDGTAGCWRRSGRERPAWPLRLAAAWPLLARAHGDSSLRRPARPESSAPASGEPLLLQRDRERDEQTRGDAAVDGIAGLRALTNMTSSSCWRAAGKPACWFIERFTVPSAPVVPRVGPSTD